MDKSHKVSGADGGVWSYSCPILNDEGLCSKNKSPYVTYTYNNLLVYYISETNYKLDPIANPTLTAVGTRSDGTTVKITFEKSGSYFGLNPASFSGNFPSLV